MNPMNPSPQAEGKRTVRNKGDIDSLMPKSHNYPVPCAGKSGKLPGLYVQVTPKGYKSFVYRFRQHGRQKTFTIGPCSAWSIDTAWGKVKELLGEVDKGANPTDTKKAERVALTVRELVEDFKVKHLDKNSSTGWAKESKRLLDRHIVPALGSMRVKDVESVDVAELLFQMAGTPTQANRVRAVVSKLFSFAEKWGLRPGLGNPARGQDRGQETPKERRLTDEELRLLGLAMGRLEPTQPGRARSPKLPEAEDHEALTTIRLLLLTGMRRSELIGDRPREIPALTWAEVDLENGWITKGHHKAARTGRKRVVALNPPALEILKAHKKLHERDLEENPHVIFGGKAGQSLVNLQNPWKAIQDQVKAIQLEQDPPVKNPLSIDDVTVHDLRRTFASVGTDLGYPKIFIKALLGHGASDVTEIYARVGKNPLQEASEAIGTRIADLLEGKEGPKEEKGKKKSPRPRSAK